MQDLEDDKHILREKFEKFTALENKSRERFQLGPYFPEKLLKHLRGMWADLRCFSKTPRDAVYIRSFFHRIPSRQAMQP